MTVPRFDAALIRRYEGSGPRYTSYPTAPQFHAGIGPAAYREAALAAAKAQTARALSLYVHIPFCASPCFYCGCNRIITRSHDRAHAYLNRLRREIELQGALFDRPVEQLHLGGGTPTFLTTREIGELVAHLGGHFALSGSADREYSIEIDPRTVSPEGVTALAALGFNRMSFGVQDLDEAVQRAVNRIQPMSQTLAVAGAARAAGVGSISFDLIYGLPRQTVASFTRTLQAVSEARPDRIAVYSYAHMPHIFKAQRRLEAEALPAPDVRLELLRLTIERLTAAGYEYIGMDHFALPGDELARAKAQRTLHRNFQGYSTRAHCDLIGLGVSAIGRVGDLYAQNSRHLPEYYAALDAGRLAIERGVRLTADDEIRHAVIQELMCHDRVDCDALGRALGIDFQRYFATELARLQPLAADGLVQLGAKEIIVTDRGRLLLRNIAMVFDAYLQPRAQVPAYSKVI